MGTPSNEVGPLRFWFELLRHVYCFPQLLAHALHVANHVTSSTLCVRHCDALHFAISPPSVTNIMWPTVTANVRRHSKSITHVLDEELECSFRFKPD